MLIGFGLAVLAAVLSGSGSVLQSIGVRRAGSAGGSAVALADLRKQPFYFAGLLSDILGFLCAATALHRLPLFFVQSVVASSVGVTALISVILGTRIGRAGWTALAIAGAGLVALAASAEPGPSTPLPRTWHWILLLGVVPIAGIGYLGYRVHRRYSAPVLALAAGLSYAAVAISARSFHAPDEFWQILGEPAAWAILVNGLSAAILFALALQKGTATTVAAVVFSTQTVFPSAVGLLVLGDSVRSGFAVVAAIGFFCAVGGAVSLAHFAAQKKHVPSIRAVPRA
ncbi:hypothetical protein EH165_11490 [Nakamurella antarctica]|uniref:Magnesium transporter NIPA n=1 Tax=Nakamurella antarctica TaxID=1902245 RepID=A0A3G8ZW42_9ACTN|nr:hypothetical protein [Nakamurella antarctica]AZI58664.1 hypothetical protein EH165_11490 [Nakamurella antarctica]